jgi:hypothetical protein
MIYIKKNKNQYLLNFYSRYYSISKPISAKEIDYNIAVKSIILAILIGLFWSSMPLIGWSEYSLEGAMISCSIEWNKQTPSVLSYNISISIFVYFIPLFILVYTNLKILSFVYIFYKNFFN